MRIAILGLGHMGAPIAERLERAGHELAVWNRSAAPTQAFAARGMKVLAVPSEAWDHAEVVITMLSNDDAVRAVTLGEDGVLAGAASAGTAADSAAGAASAGTTAGASSAANPPSTAGVPSARGTLIDMSTISATASAEIAVACKDAGVEYLRAPVSGNPSVVVAGNLGIIVSGPRDEYERLAAMLRQIGPNLFHVGEGEQARIVKIALQVMLGGTTQLLAEALVLGEHYGLDRGDMIDVIGASAIGSPYVKYKRETVVQRDYTSTFTAELMRKDLDMALTAGHDAGVPLPVTALVQQLMESAIAQGMGELDVAVLVPRLERESASRQ